jgi:hypothetical protein
MARKNGRTTPTQLLRHNFMTNLLNGNPSSDLRSE